MSSPERITIRVKESRRFAFYMVDNEIIDVYASKIGVYGVALYNFFCRHANQGAVQIFSTSAAKCLGMSRSKFFETVSVLCEEGLISRESSVDSDGLHHASIYTLLPVPKSRTRKENDKESATESDGGSPPDGLPPSPSGGLGSSVIRTTVVHEVDGKELNTTSSDTKETNTYSPSAESENDSASGESGRDTLVDEKQNLIPWMEKVWREHQLTYKLEWPGLKFPVGYEKQEEQIGKQKYRQLWIDYLSTSKRPYPYGFYLSVKEAYGIESRGKRNTTREGAAPRTRGRGTVQEEVEFTKALYARMSGNAG